MPEQMQIMILHGPNLNMLGEREPGVYGNVTLQQINDRLEEKAGKLGLTLEIHQSNHEGVLTDLIQEASGRCAGVLINPAALSHYSIALLDALRSLKIPVVEVHLSNIYARETYRQESVISQGVNGVISGLGPESYLLGLDALNSLIRGGN